MLQIQLFKIFLHKKKCGAFLKVGVGAYTPPWPPDSYAPLNNYISTTGLET